MQDQVCIMVLWRRAGALLYILTEMNGTVIPG